VLNTRFDNTGQLCDLDDALICLREAFERQTSLGSDRLIFLRSLARGLNRIFEQKRQLDMLDEAVSVHRMALELHPEDHANRSSLLNNVSDSLNTRFIHTFNLTAVVN